MHSAVTAMALHYQVMKICKNCGDQVGLFFKWKAATWKLN